jgi:hypothetical protein
MRNKRTKLENWAISQLTSLLESEGENWTEDSSIIDAPDLVMDDYASGM